MIIQSADLKQDPKGRAVLTLTVDASPADCSKTVYDIQHGVRCSVSIKPYKEPKSHEQLGAIWGKIGEIADALYLPKEEVYEICLKRYGPSDAMRIRTSSLASIASRYRYVDVGPTRQEDDTVFVKGYKGLSEMNTAEASRLLEGVLSECREMGLSTEVKNG